MAETNTGHAYSYHDSVAQQASALPYSGLQGQAEPANRPHEPASAIVQEDFNCPICLDLLLEPVVGACGHEFCKDCYTRWLARSRAYPSCPLCRKVLAFAVPGVSRKLADLIEATFPEKILLRRQTREREAATEVKAAPLQVSTGQASQLNVDELEDYEEPPVPEPAAASLFVTDGAHVMLMLQMARHSRRPDSPYPGRGAYEGTTDIVRSHTPDSSSDSSSASSLPDSWSGSPRHSSPPSMAYFPTSPYHSPISPMSLPTSPAYPSASTRRSPTLPGHPSESTYSPTAHSPRSPSDSPASPGYRRDSHVHDSPNHCPWSTDNPYPNYSSLTTGIQPFVNGTHDYSPVLQARAPPRRASVSPQRPPGGAAGIARPPSRPPSSVTEVSEMYRQDAGRTAPAARQGLHDTPPAAADVATTAETESAHDQPQLRAAPPQPAQHRDFSRLLQSTDQLAQQLQMASERLTYLTEYAGQSFARHGLAPPPLATQPQVSYLPYSLGTACPYAPMPLSLAPLATYSHYDAPAPAACHSVPLNCVPWGSAYSYGHYTAPAPENSSAQTISPSSNSFAQPMPLPPGNSFAQAMPPSSGSFAGYMAPLSGSSFAQSMPPPGTLRFTIGSEPREAPDSSRRAQVAAVARNPARYRGRVPPSRRRDGGARALR